jgi:hypothetical protein
LFRMNLLNEELWSCLPSLCASAGGGSASRLGFFSPSLWSLCLFVLHSHFVKKLCYPLQDWDWIDIYVLIRLLSFCIKKCFETSQAEK